jgi:hypothetical protein
LNTGDMVERSRPIATVSAWGQNRPQADGKGRVRIGPIAAWRAALPGESQMVHRNCATFIPASFFLAACASLSGGEASRNPSIVGAWSAEVILVDCASGQAAPAPPFRAIVVFHAGGTLSESSGPPARRTPSFGTWSASGANEYLASSLLLTYDSNGKYSGAQEIRRTILVSPDGNRFAADTQSVATDTSGAVTFRGCARGQAERI